MGYTRDIAGFQVDFAVSGYEEPNEDIDKYDQWCQCDFYFKFGNGMEYKHFGDETLMSSEIDEMESSFTELLEGKITEVTEIPFVEPDFAFYLYPDKKVRPQMDSFTYNLHSYKDVSMEWRIYFWNGGLTDNYMTLTLDRDDITALRDYLREVQGKKSIN